MEPAHGNLRQGLAAAAGAALVVAGFFAPWMDGAAEFALRSFSGSDFARLVRNFEIVADTSRQAAGVRVSAVALYLVPALAVNAAVMQVAVRVLPAPRVARLAGVTAGVYALAILAAILFLSSIPVNDFARVVGPPSWGFGLTAVGGTLLIASGTWTLAPRRPSG